MITLTLDLPPTYALISIHNRYNGKWMVCVRRALPPEYNVTETVALGEDEDINEACRIAIERCDLKVAMLGKQQEEHRQRQRALPNITLKL